MDMTSIDLFKDHVSRSKGLNCYRSQSSLKQEKTEATKSSQPPKYGQAPLRHSEDIVAEKEVITLSLPVELWYQNKLGLETGKERSGAEKFHPCGQISSRITRP